MLSMSNEDYFPAVRRPSEQSGKVAAAARDSDQTLDQGRSVL
jgi:hypothetical protein